MVNLFTNQTTNDTSDAVEINDGGYRLLKCTGTFDGASITIEVDFGDGEYAPIQASIFTQEDIKTIQPLKSGTRVRAALTDAGASTDITVALL